MYRQSILSELFNLALEFPKNNELKKKSLQKEKISAKLLSTKFQSSLLNDLRRAPGFEPGT